MLSLQRHGDNRAHTHGLIITGCSRHGRVSHGPYQQVSAGEVPGYLSRVGRPIRRAVRMKRPGSLSLATPALALYCVRSCCCHLQ